MPFTHGLHEQNRENLHLYTTTCGSTMGYGYMKLCYTSRASDDASLLEIDHCHSIRLLPGEAKPHVSRLNRIEMMGTCAFAMTKIKLVILEIF